MRTCARLARARPHGSSQADSHRCSPALMQARGGCAKARPLVKTARAETRQQQRRAALARTAQSEWESRSHGPCAVAAAKLTPGASAAAGIATGFVRRLAPAVVGGGEEPGFGPKLELCSSYIVSLKPYPVVKPYDNDSFPSGPLDATPRWSPPTARPTPVNQAR